MTKYKVLLHWDDFRKYSPREGEIIVDGYAIGQILDRIFFENQNDFNPKSVPSACVGDIIVLDDGMRFRIEDVGFNELCSKDGDRTCDICGKFYLKREETPKAVYINVKNTFYPNRNNLCKKCFREYGKVVKSKSKK